MKLKLKQKKQKFEQMDIDEILDRAETTEDATTAGEELLNAFKVASFTTTDEENDPDFWKKVIPQAIIQEQESEEVVKTMWLPPRKTRAAQFNPEEEELKDKKKEKTSKKQISNKLLPKEIRILVNSIIKFGEQNRSNEIIADSKLTKSPEIIEKAIQDIVEACKKKKIESDEPKKATIEYEGARINASEVVDRLEDLSFLAKKISPYSKKLSSFRLSIIIKPVRGWGIQWSHKDDAMLLVGIYKHGFGNWDIIREDKELNLDRTKSQSAEPLPKSADLKKRAEQLIKTLRNERDEKKQVSNKKPVEGKKRSAEDIHPKKALLKRRKIEDQEKNKTKQKERTKSKEEKGDEDEDDDEDDDDETYDPELLSKCKQYLQAVQQELKNFKDMSSNKTKMSSEEKIKFTKKYLSTIGKEITSIVSKKPKLMQENLEKHLWHYASSFTAYNGPGLKRIFSLLQKS